MARWVALKTLDDQSSPVYVNLDNVASIHRTPLGSVIHCIGSEPFVVSDTPELIMAAGGTPHA